MIDIHTHILPGVDDGARTMEDAVAMVKAAVRAGTRTIVATPHMLHPQWSVDAEIALKTAEELRVELARKRIKVNVHVGGEVYLREDLVEQFDDRRILPLCGTGRYMLIELPFNHEPSETRQRFRHLQSEGIHPVVAHPERNMAFARDPDQVQQLRNSGVPIQIDAGSFFGSFGDRAKLLADRWLADGCVDAIASDTHSLKRRPPSLKKAAKYVRKQAGSSAEDWVTFEAPRRILAGERVIE